MKVLLLLNGPEGFQTGIEDGFKLLQSNGEIKDINWFYYESYKNRFSAENCISRILELCIEFQPNLIVFFHIGRFPITKKIVDILKNIASRPIIVYDEGDMYGGFSKPITSSMKILMKECDLVSIRGLGNWYRKVKSLNNNIIYTPHCNSIYRFMKDITINQNRDNNIVFIGNSVKSRVGNIRRLSGAKGRESLVKYIDNNFNDCFLLYGKGWEDVTANKGSLEFIKQAEVCNKSWIHLSYEHYPEIPYYFSDRLPIALSAGQIYICHYHEGYDNIFKNCDFIYFFRTNEEAVDIINYVKSLSTKELMSKSKNAKLFSDTHLSPYVIWKNFLKDCIVAKDNLVPF